MPWITLEDGTPIHVTMAKRGAKLTEEDIKALREIAEAARRKHFADIENHFLNGNWKPGDPEPIGILNSALDGEAKA